MFCTECGCKIEEGYRFCPRCGAPVVQGAPTDARPEVERIADEIFWKCPVSRGKAEELSRRTGIRHDIAYDMIAMRFKEYKEKKKRGELPDTQYCPCCGSQDINEFHKPGMVFTRQSSAFKRMLISSQTDGVDMLRCRNCGKKWVPKKRKIK